MANDTDNLLEADLTFQTVEADLTWEDNALLDEDDESLLDEDGEILTWG